MKLIFILLILCFLLIAVSVFYFITSNRMQKTQQRFSTWFEQDNRKERKSFVLLIGDKYDESDLSSELRKKLVQANLNLKPSEFNGICIMTFSALWFINHFLLKLVFPLDAALAYFLVWLGSKVYLGSRKNKRTESFNKQLPEICRMMSNAVKAGLTIPQGIELIANEMHAPAGPEFRKMNQQLKLGDSFDEVMDRFRDRISSNDLNIFVNTMLIQRRVGGNLSEILSLMAETLEERSRVHKEIETVTAEAKFVSYILPIMPILMSLMMNLFIPGFLNPLFTPYGLLLLGFFSMMSFIAFFLIKQITKIRV